MSLEPPTSSGCPFVQSEECMNDVLVAVYCILKTLNRNGTNCVNAELTATDSISRVSHVTRAVEAANTVCAICIHITVVSSKDTLINICKKNNKKNKKKHG